MAARDRSPHVLGVVALGLSLASYALPSGRNGEVRAARQQQALATPVQGASTVRAQARPPLVRRPEPALNTIAKAPAARREAPPASRTAYLPEPGANNVAPLPDPANGSAEPELYQRWSNEQRDPSWTAEIAEYLRETSAAAGLDSDAIVQDADCGSSLCRVNLRFDSYEQAGAFQESAHNPDFRYQSLPQADGDGLDVVVYVPRAAQGG